MSFTPKLSRKQFIELAGKTCLVEFDTRRLVAYGETLEEAEEKLKQLGEAIECYVYVVPFNWKELPAAEVEDL